MSASKILLCCVVMILCSIGFMEGGYRVAAQDGPLSDDMAADEHQPRPKGNGQSVSDNQGTGDDMAADEQEPQPKKGKRSKAKKGGKKEKKGKKEKQHKPGLKPEVRDAKFKDLEVFHNNWFNLPPNKVKKTLEEAIKFCHAACTKEQCSDTMVSNHCHLMCPKSTLKDCPDLNPPAQTPSGAMGAPMLPGPQQQQPQVPMQPSPENLANQQQPVITVNGAPPEQVPMPNQQMQMPPPMQQPMPDQQMAVPMQAMPMPIPSQPNAILPADQAGGG